MTFNCERVVLLPGKRAVLKGRTATLHHHADDAAYRIKKTICRVVEEAPADSGAASRIITGEPTTTTLKARSKEEPTSGLQRGTYRRTLVKDGAKARGC